MCVRNECLPSMLQVLWMNTILKTMWPYYNQAIGQQVLEQTGPIIAEQLKPVRARSSMTALQGLIMLHITPHFQAPNYPRDAASLWQYRALLNPRQ